jgi:hypothetical protein
MSIDFFMQQQPQMDNNSQLKLQSTYEDGFEGSELPSYDGPGFGSEFVL